ncbi:methionine ABC transporter permease [Enterococcus alcedinis]|uniref:ABC transporter permease n=1 Tax=Enterococcus alcedinis TaxID=1274384 RepID=A0A917JGI2_9ENTE|nr:methionine ABC transporter permease [Enterococcus alcedinis]MBP2102770.1 D-methionine transport system permease protein [Enterococcus alcedinis]GGI66331.1 ABC transporter permease [Enterococcus alcedinis]
MTLSEQIVYYWPELQLSLEQTAIMMGISLFFALVIGLPLGIGLFLSNPKFTQKKTVSYWVLNAIVSVIRSYPFLLLVVTLIPVVRFLIGRAFGPVPASFPLSLVAVAIFARLVEQVLLDIPQEIRLLADSLGANKWQYICYFLLVEGRSGLILAFTTTIVSMVSYSTVMGIVGGGGIGDFAIRYGYQSYQYGIMYLAIILMVCFVFLIQMIGNQIAYQLDKRK